MLGLDVGFIWKGLRIFGLTIHFYSAVAHGCGFFPRCSLKGGYEVARGFVGVSVMLPRVPALVLIYVNFLCVRFEYIASVPGAFISDEGKLRCGFALGFSCLCV